MSSRTSEHKHGHRGADGTLFGLAAMSSPVMGINPDPDGGWGARIFPLGRVGQRMVILGVVFWSAPKA